LMRSITCRAVIPLVDEAFTDWAIELVAVAIIKRKTAAVCLT
jgi:hypothetical protein